MILKTQMHLAYNEKKSNKPKPHQNSTKKTHKTHPTKFLMKPVFQKNNATANSIKKKPPKPQKLKTPNSIPNDKKNPIQQTTKLQLHGEKRINIHII